MRRPDAAVHRQTERRALLRRFRSATRPASTLGALSVLAVLVPSATQNAVANSDTRTIYLYHSHTQESIAATYRVNGQYDAAVLKQLNWFLRDWRRDEPTTMDPRLFDAVWETYRSAGAATNPIVVVSAYRSPATNAMLRRRSRAVAEFSQHMMGKAMDTTMPGLSMAQVREIGMKLQRGGVGYYPSAGTPFVHLDVGSVRSWPRMGYDQLARLFPDGKTVHLPSNGQPLARYEEARAEIASRGAVAPPSSTSTGFLAWLFGGSSGGGDDEDAAPAAAPPPVQAPGRRGRTQVASAAPPPATASSYLAATGDDSGRDFFVAQAYRNQPAAPAPQPAPAPSVAEAESNLPRGETTMSAPPAAPQPARQAPQQLAALSPEPDVEPEPKPFASSHPAPPRRPADLVAYADVPTPPARPSSLPAIASFSLLPPGASAYARVEPPPLRRDPIGSLIEGSRKEDSRAAIVPARLDRSNFGAMTAGTPAARMTSHAAAASGPTLVAPRSAARANGALLSPKPAGVAAGFGEDATDLSTSAFGATRGRR